ncbi:ABC transporter permease [Propionibacterium freudenreichii]|uniref:ABC transporter permease n=1 Tax=Propionibacterium freudenreichii TaxID=1744 RepID=UPI0018C5DCDA|nr:ABC transporter permease [Propionibacterium freudenreichii]
MKRNPARWCSCWRIFTHGGLVSFRALFGWLNPWIYIPSMLIVPVFQILLFAYMGRAAGVENDQFYLIGNALQYSAIPCLSAMSQTIAGERWTQTLGIILVSPAPRLILFLGRSLPVIANGWIISVTSLVTGSLVLGTQFRFATLCLIAIVGASSSFACSGLGLVVGAVNLRARDAGVLNNILFGVLLIASGANVPLSKLPDWVAGLGEFLPLTHAISASRLLASGSDLVSVRSLVFSEVVVGIAFMAVGLLALRFLEKMGHKRATLEIQ